jgi:hypothetical protein
MTTHGTASIPGNKRHPRSRAAKLEWTDNPELELRLAGVEGPPSQPSKSLAALNERAAVLGRLPVWLLVGAFERDEAFLVGLERVLCGDEKPEELAARYQRRRSYGHQVMIALIETAIQKATASLVTHELSGDRTRAALRAGLVVHMDVHYIVDAEVAPGERQRWRDPIWRREAVETLLALGANRCIAPGCGTNLRAAEGVRYYCGAHWKQGRSVAARRHDAAIARVGELLEEVGGLLNVPRA